MTAPRSLRERSQAASPEAAAAAEARRDAETAIKFRWPKNKGPRHFRGRVTIPDEIFPSEYVNQDTGEVRTTDRMKVIISPDAEIFEPNERYEGSEPLTFYVSLPAEGAEPRPNAEIVLTTASIRECETAKRLGITHYADLDGKVVDMQADVKIEPKRAEFDKNGRKLYDFEAFFYRVNWVGADGSAASAPSLEPEAADVQALALSLVGKEPKDIKKMDLVKWTAQNKESLVNQVALTAFIQLPTTNFVEYVSSQGLLVVGEDGKLLDPVS